MTIRNSLAKKFKLVNLLVLFGFIAFVLSLFFPSLFVCVPIGLLVFGFVYLLLGIRCPRCQNRVGQNLGNLKSFSKTGKKLKFCPYCAIDLDSEITPK